MVSERYGIAFAETLYYLKGINQDDINKIPKLFMNFLRENADAKYECKFDYNKPLDELELTAETKGMIAMICLNYWCDTEENKKIFVKHLNENEIKYQEELRRKYNVNDMFKRTDEPKEKKKTQENELPVQVENDGIIKRILKKIKSCFR